MPLRALKTLLGKRRLADPADTADVDQLIRHGAERFAAWATRLLGQEVAIDPDAIANAEIAIEQARDSTSGTDEIPHHLASDCAAFLGEAIRTRHGGEWEEDTLLGLVLRQPGNVSGASLVPLAIVEKKWQLGGGLKISRFVETLPERLQAEREHQGTLPSPGRTPQDIARSLLAQGPPDHTATQAAGEFQKFWRERFGQPLPLSLQGVRETERFLRSHFFLFALRHETLVQMGLFVGEVGRGLFQGQWNLDEVRRDLDPTRAALAWPELSYYPVGRIYRLLTEQPEGETLDEYLRLIPSARAELRAACARKTPSPNAPSS